MKFYQIAMVWTYGFVATFYLILWITLTSDVYVSLWDPDFIKSSRIKSCPWIGEHPYIEMFLRQFYYIIFLSILLKNARSTFNLSFFSNTWDRIKKRVKTMGQICPLLSTRNRTLDWRRTMYWNIVLAFFQQPWCRHLCWKISVTKML